MSEQSTTTSSEPAPVDPRRQSFARVPARPVIPPDQAVPSDGDRGAGGEHSDDDGTGGGEVPVLRRLEGLAPPPKQRAVVVDDVAAEPEPALRPLPERTEDRDGTGPARPPSSPATSPPGPADEVPAPAPAPRPARRAGKQAATRPKPTPTDTDTDFDPSEFGTLRGRTKWITTSLPRDVSDRLDDAARDCSFGEFLMTAVRANHHDVVAEVSPPEASPDDPFPAPRPRQLRPRGGSIRRDFGVQPAEAEAIARVAVDLGITPAAYMRLVLERQLRAPEPTLD